MFPFFVPKNADLSICLGVSPDQGWEVKSRPPLKLKTRDSLPRCFSTNGDAKQLVWSSDCKISDLEKIVKPSETGSPASFPSVISCIHGTTAKQELAQKNVIVDLEVKEEGLLCLETFGNSCHNFLFQSVEALRLLERKLLIHIIHDW